MCRPPAFTTSNGVYFERLCIRLYAYASVHIQKRSILKALVCLILPAQNTIAPLKPKKSKPKTEPWLNDNFRSLRQASRRAERKWKKDKLQISYEMFKDCFATLQKAVKSTKSKYFSNLIAKNHHSSKALFSVINSVLNPSVNVISNPSVHINLKTEFPILR